MGHQVARTRQGEERDQWRSASGSGSSVDTALTSHVFPVRHPFRAEDREHPRFALAATIIVEIDMKPVTAAAESLSVFDCSTARFHGALKTPQSCRGELWEAGPQAMHTPWG